MECANIGVCNRNDADTGVIINTLLNVWLHRSNAGKLRLPHRLHWGSLSAPCAFPASMFSFPPVKRVVYFPPYAPRQSASNHLYVVECAQACNNYGKCITMYNAALDYGPDQTAGQVYSGDGFGPVYKNWEAEFLMMCICDWGTMGPECGTRMCPKGSVSYTHLTLPTKA